VIRALAVAALLIGCSDRPQLRIVVDLPPAGSAADPFGGGIIDSLSLSVLSPDGSGESITRAPDEPLVIDDVPFGRGLVVEIDGVLGGTQTAYGRSCPFDFDGDLGGPAELHVYFSRVRRWGVGPSALVAGRLGGHAYTRKSGEVYIAGGIAGGVLESFDPRTGAFAAVADAPPSLARIGSVLVRIGDDGAIIVGGTDASESPVIQVETLPDLRDSLSDGPPLRRHAGVELFGGRALIVGGEELAGGAFGVTGAAREYQLEGTTVAPGGAIPSLAFPRAGHTATRLFEDLGVAVLIAGGVDGAGAPVTAAEVYRPLSQNFEILPGTLDRHGHRAIRLDGNFVLIAGGFLGDGTPVRELQLYDPVQGTFKPAGELPAAAAITDFAATPMADGRVMLTGGRDETGAIVAAAHLASLDAFDGTVTISETNFLSTPRASHIGVELCDHSLMLVGGESTDGGAPPTERYVPGE
jgi:hypothetical protein